ncbi:MAG: hypothetical protein JW999_06030 [Methanotrichaceae archaeon]|nr:hypothetical protein [Methanotrichaceae archaeon]
MKYETAYRAAIGSSIPTRADARTCVNASPPCRHPRKPGRPGPTRAAGSRAAQKRGPAAVRRCCRSPENRKAEAESDLSAKKVSVRPLCALCLCGGIVSCMVIIIS